MDQTPITHDDASTRPVARADHSRFVQRVRRALAAELHQLDAGVPRRAGIEQALARLTQARP
ncbi:MAG: hypothetical protein AB9M60_18285, partial [Leptothrix sp. (in: b-proteobacteria)]